MATHSSVLTWRKPGTRSLVGCCLWGRTELDTTEATQQQQLIAKQRNLPTDFWVSSGSQGRTEGKRWPRVQKSPFPLILSQCIRLSGVYQLSVNMLVRSGSGHRAQNKFAGVFSYVRVEVLKRFKVGGNTSMLEQQVALLLWGDRSEGGGDLSLNMTNIRGTDPRGST